MTEMQRFLRAMDGEWEVTRYELLPDNRVRVHCRSLTDPGVEWGIAPFNQDIPKLPKIGQRGRIGFLTNDTISQQDIGPRSKP